VGYHLIPVIGDDNLGAQVTRIKDVIESHKGVVITDEFPKHLELTYPMVKITENKRATYTSAYFGWIKFEVTPDGAVAIDKDLKANTEILRFMLVKTVRENTMAPKKVVMAKKEEGSVRPTEPKEEVPEMTEEELDKTIEELVIN
jgi:ribosomal protein S6